MTLRQAWLFRYPRERWIFILGIIGGMTGGLWFPEIEGLVYGPAPDFAAAWKAKGTQTIVSGVMFLGVTGWMTYKDQKEQAQESAGHGEGI